MADKDELRTEPVLLEFEKVRIISAPDWPKNWLGTGTKPGDILLLDGAWGTAGGILRLTSRGAFINLTPDQVFRSEMIRWPNNVIEGITIHGEQVEMVAKRKAPLSLETAEQ